MARTYPLTASLYTGRTSDTSDGNWSTYDSRYITQSDTVGYAGKEGSWYYATNMMFNSTELDPLRSKTVTSITLTLNVTQAMTAAGLIAWKLNSTQSGNSNSKAWARGNNAGTATAGDSSIATTDNPSFPAQSLVVGTRTFTLKELPQYGLVAGPYSSGTNGRWRFSSAIMYVTTNESLTLSYDGNGSGSTNVPSSSTSDGNPNHTFTISTTTPTRAGYSFLGWSTSSTATTASYYPGGTITLSSNVILYAVWKLANTIRIVNGSSLDLYLVYVVENNALSPYLVRVVNGSNLDIYT